MIENLFKQAVSLHTAGKFVAARELYEYLDRKVGPHPEILHLYGTLLFQTGAPGEGQRTIRRAILLRPDASSYYDHFGGAARSAEERLTAAAAFDRAFRLNPASETASLNAAIVLQELKNFAGAARPAIRAVLLQPSAATTWLRHGGIQRALGNLTQAETALKRARLEDPTNLDAHFQLHEVCVGLNRIDQARLSAKRGILLSPGRHEFYVNFSSGDSEMPRRRAGFLRPDAPKVWDQLSTNYYAQVKYKAATEAARRAILLAPNLAPPYNSAGTSMFHDGRFTEAIRASRHALVIDPYFSDTEYNLCMAAFCRGQLDLAWRHWNSRLTMTKSPGRVGVPERWDLKCGRPQHLLVASEQGVGDDILFLSCLPDLLGHAGKITVETDPRLHTMLARTFPGIGLVEKQLRLTEDGVAVHDYRDLVREKGFTHAVYSGDLPARFRAGPTAGNAIAGYLHPDDAEREHWQNWLRSLGPGPYLGLCWRSGTYVTRQRRTGYFSPEELTAQIPDGAVTLISLQYGDAGDELQRVLENTGVRIHNPPGLDQVKELDRVLALMTCLDLIVTPATTVQALAGASGVPTIGLDKSNFHYTDGRDPIFANLYPVKHPDEPTLTDGLAERFGKALRHFLETGSLPFRKP